jgi:hypothetical protein
MHDETNCFHSHSPLLPRPLPSPPLQSTIDAIRERPRHKRVRKLPRNAPQFALPKRLRRLRARQPVRIPRESPQRMSSPSLVRRVSLAHVLPCLSRLCCRMRTPLSPLDVAPAHHCLIVSTSAV